MIAGAGGLTAKKALEGAGELVSGETHRRRERRAVFAQHRPESASVPVRAVAIPRPRVDGVPDRVLRHVFQPDAAFDQCQAEIGLLAGAEDRAAAGPETFVERRVRERFPPEKERGRDGRAPDIAGGHAAGCRRHVAASREASGAVGHERGNAAEVGSAEEFGANGTEQTGRVFAIVVGERHEAPDGVLQAEISARRQPRGTAEHTHRKPAAVRETVRQAVRRLVDQDHLERAIGLFAQGVQKQAQGLRAAERADDQREIGRVGFKAHAQPLTPGPPACPAAGCRRRPGGRTRGPVSANGSRRRR